MLSTILIFVSIMFYAKPIYWLGKMTYVYYKYHDQQTMMQENPLVTEYRNKLKGWFAQIWSIVKWQRADL